MSLTPIKPTSYILKHLLNPLIGKRGSADGVIRRERIQYARDILQREVYPYIHTYTHTYILTYIYTYTHIHIYTQALPHVGTMENCETKKAFFIGYTVHKMLMCSLGRIEQDDRDHFGKKRLDLAGPLLGNTYT
jgi:DNA-directed RNA polymerase II subunit RPB2